MMNLFLLLVGCNLIVNVKSGIEPTCDAPGSSCEDEGTAADGSDMGVPQEMYPEYAKKFEEIFDFAREYLEEEEKHADANVRARCYNTHQHCAYWAITGFCDSHPDFMYAKCAPLCQACHEVTAALPMDEFLKMFQPSDASPISTDGSARGGGKSSSAVDHAHSQIEWIVSKGGMFNSKVEMRRFVPDDPESPTGMFVREDVPEGEVMMVIPKETLLTSGGSLETCDTIHNLVEEFEKGEASEFWPYVNWMFDPRFKGDLPSSFSKSGKELLWDITGEEIFPTLSITDALYHCWESPPKPVLYESYIAVLRRSWDDIMVPVFDMVNHRNGHWFNIDSNSAHEGKDITVKATRDIKAGEQLYLSYNECEDCDYAFTYTGEQIARDYGFVEQYPQRWNLFDNELVVELDESEEKGGVHLSRLLSREGLDSDTVEWGESVHILHGHLKRLKDMKDDVYDRAQELISEHEQGFAVNLYDAMVTALEHAIWYMRGKLKPVVNNESDDEDDENEESSDDEDKSEKSSSSSPINTSQYDNFEELPYNVEFSWNVCDYHGRLGIGGFMQNNGYELVDEDASMYQSIDFYHSEEVDDTCLLLSDHQEACTSLRPQYHEQLVHYAASYIGTVKRVLFVGGGDNMILHEILKYPSLERLVGLELDQKVVRNSFRHLGTQPHWDNEKVEWWYGDAVKSLAILPEEYYGSFDLVLVDLKLAVVKMLGIEDDISRLLTPTGIIMRNEDGEFGTNDAFAKYTVDLLENEIPHWCHQGLTLGSNSVDFLTHPYTNHNIEGFVFKPAHNNEEHFKLWYNYRLNQGYRAPVKMSKSVTSQISGSSPAPGVLMVIEAEDSVADLTSTETIQEKISSALKTSGLSELNVLQSTFEGGNAIVFILREGYVAVRIWPEHKYCAFDLLLWSDIKKQSAAEANLLEAVGSKLSGTSSSSFRVVTAGMLQDSMLRDSSKITEEEETKTPNNDPVQKNAPANDSEVSKVISESISLVQEKDAQIVVVCGEREKSCNTLDTFIKMDTGRKAAVALWTCNDIDGENEGVCESETQQNLQDFVEKNGKIGAFVVDPNTPLTMGKMVQKILSSPQLRNELLMDKYSVIGISLSPESSWHRTFLDRFRTQFSVYNPAFVTKILLQEASGYMELGVFSSGDQHFFSHLVDAMARLKKSTGLVSEIHFVKNGLNNYIAEFETHAFTHDTYRSRSTVEHWKSQQPIGEQTIVQLENKEESLEISPFELVDALLDTFGDDAEELSVKAYSDVFKGCVIVAIWSEGTALVLWDGKNRVDVNLFTIENYKHPWHKVFGKAFETTFPSFNVIAIDEMPRGYGRVVNSRKDLSDTPPPFRPSPLTGATN